MTQEAPPTHPIVNTYASAVRSWFDHLPKRQDVMRWDGSNVHFITPRAKATHQRAIPDCKIVLPEDSHLHDIAYQLITWAYTDTQDGDFNYKTQQLILRMHHAYEHSHDELAQEKRIVLNAKRELQRAMEHPDDMRKNFPQLGFLLAYIEEKNIKHARRDSRKQEQDEQIRITIDQDNIERLITQTTILLEKRAALYPAHDEHGNVRRLFSVEHDTRFGEQFMHCLRSIQQQPDDFLPALRKLYQFSAPRGKHSKHNTKTEAYNESISALIRYITIEPHMSDTSEVIISLRKAILPTQHVASSIAEHGHTATLHTLRSKFSDQKDGPQR